jgi:hypothetical protein
MNAPPFSPPYYLVQIESDFACLPPSTIAATIPTNTSIFLLQFNHLMFHLPFFEISINMTFTNLPVVPLTWWRSYLSTGKNQNTAQYSKFFVIFYQIFHKCLLLRHLSSIVQ